MHKIYKYVYIYVARLDYRQTDNLCIVCLHYTKYLTSTVKYTTYMLVNNVGMIIFEKVDSDTACLDYSITAMLTYFLNKFT